MLVYVYLTVYFLNKLVLASEEVIKNNQHDTENAFADVIQNISRVNNVLQELITNYEHLQKLYKSQETVVTENDSSTEDSDEHLAIQKSGNNQQINIMKISTHRREPSNFGATQMILSEDDSIVRNDEPSDMTKENKLSKDNSPRIENLHLSDTKKKQHNIIKGLSGLSSDKSEETDEEHIESDKNTNKKQSLQTDSDEITKNLQTTKRDPKIISIDTKKKRLNKLRHTPQPNILPESHSEYTTKIKTRYVVRPNKRQGKALVNDTFPKKGNLSRHNVKNIVYSEKFSENIWDEIINKKPIQLEKEEVVTYDNDINRIFNGSEVKPRTNNLKNALVIILKILRLKYNHNCRKKKKNEASISELSEENQSINKDIFKTNILRKAYGDACLKLVIRKCFKACEEVTKTVCRRHKCKKSLRNVLKENSKSGCIRYFREPETNNTNVSKSKYGVKYRGKDAPDTEATNFIDLTRSGYLAAACWPNTANVRVTRPDNTLFSVLPVNEAKQLNVLRDKYERACQKVSREKCESACTYTYETSCSSRDCSSGMKKFFKKTCKWQCKRAYRVDDRDKSSSDESTDSKDSSDSSSKSDSSSSS